MHIAPRLAFTDRIPDLLPGLEPPEVLGVAALAEPCFAGEALDALLARVDRPISGLIDAAALAFDSAIAYQLGFRRPAGLALQMQALRHCQTWRVRSGHINPGRIEPGRTAHPEAILPPLRMLALMAPGDLMVNTPLDFITAHLNIRLDLLFLLPDRPLPLVVPDHDIAFCAVSESDSAALARLAPLVAAWPRPVLNRPEAAASLSRDGTTRLLADIAGLHCPPTLHVSRAALAANAGNPTALHPALTFPLLLRPHGSHGGAGLERVTDAAGLVACLALSAADSFFLSPFVDYRSPDGLHRKYRIAFAGGVPALCHMAISDHWMIHYLNADMAGSAAKRAEEAHMMVQFDTGFATHHAAALAEIDRRIGLDYYSIDCAETQTGELLLFEADVAAIVHDMDPPALYPYKAAAMRKVFDAFDLMARQRARPGLA